MTKDNPEIGKSVPTGAYLTNYHDTGEVAGVDACPLLLVHGSGPGVSAWANWRGCIPILAERRRIVAPDMAGFGFTERLPGQVYDRAIWCRQLLDLMTALKVDKIDIVGNSFGGAIGLAFAIAHPDRVRRLVLMGSAGVSFPITPGLDAVWGYEPSLETMKGLLNIFAFDRALVTDELAELRYRSSIQPGFQESFSAMFPAPRQRWVDALASDEQLIGQLPHRALVIHGRDDKIIPLAASLRLHELLANSDLHLFARCGHWTQIERTSEFCALVQAFLAAD
ncbi:alpha/beta fold hydrolase [Sphingobium sp.]|uniref:alpha/beta fold hydrolase n=2 Tax=Sphingobium TaxID=165695 RepID=UPI000262B75A